MTRLILVTLLCVPCFAVCTATKQNADYGAVGSSTTATVSVTVHAVGDLVAFTAWCYSGTGGCTPVSVVMGSQTATKTTVSGVAGAGSPGSGQGFIYYILAAAAAGVQTATFTASGASGGTQISYIDFSTTAGCTFTHNVDSALGSCLSNCGNTGNPGSITAPSITPTAGDLLFNFTWSSEHVNDILSPWSCPIYSGPGETQDCQFVDTRNVAAYILSASAGSTSNNTTDTHDSDTWQALISSFTMSSGNCPAGIPITGNHCFFISAAGSDANTGTDISHPWAHAPGMPNCSANCAALGSGSGTLGFIFRGGDTWHFGTATAPSTGGTWDIFNWFIYTYTHDISSVCKFEGTQTGCVYFGVDPTWFTGASWTRPIMTGDNPTSTSLVGSCSRQISGTPSPLNNNNMVSMASGSILDNLEFTGLCSQDSNVTSGTQDTYIAYVGTSTGNGADAFLTNVYIHGWTATTTAGHGGNNQPCTLIGGGANGKQTFDHIVVDGQDSNPGSCAWGTFPGFNHFRDSIVRYTNQGVGQSCHDIHDNIFEHMYNHNAVAGSHTNVLECNDDANPPTANVFYNNILRHDDPGLVGSGQVHFWFCPESAPEYWFNNLIYDVTPEGGNGWAYAGPPVYACTNTGGQFMFNNTFVDFLIPCKPSTDSNGGRYLTVLNNHLINTGYYDSTSAPNACTGGPASATNVVQTNAQATSQGYTTGTSGTVGNGNNCANDSTTPCSPTASGNITVGAGANHQDYCTALAAFTSETAIGVDAANACKYGTTDGCTYNLTTHAMSCPAQVAVLRPVSGAWNSGAYEFSGSVLNPPTGLTVTAH